jgi:hypothetical protein
MEFSLDQEQGQDPTRSDSRMSVEACCECKFDFVREKMDEASGFAGMRILQKLRGG